MATEVAKLKRQLAEQAEEELEIVKKVATYFVYGIHGFYKIKMQWIRCGRIFGFLLKELPSNL